MTNNGFAVEILINEGHGWEASGEMVESDSKGATTKEDKKELAAIRKELASDGTKTRLRVVRLA